MIKSSYPQLKLIDLKNSHFSKNYLWNKFQMDKFNFELMRSLSKHEKMHFMNLSKLFNSSKDPSCKDRMFIWDLGFIQGNSKSNKSR